MKTLIDIVNNPRKYDWVICVPGAFDAAEALLPHWEQLNRRTRLKVQEILVRSGRYSV
ncbi:MAG TPA: hypothetical protein VFE32_17200 [Puia sp.]|nr:hypothetical protein [Puia sp.]